MCVAGANIVQAVGQGVQAVSDYAMGNANAKLARYEGDAAMSSANAQAFQVGRQGERFLSTMRSRQAASGVDITSGSAADVQAESAGNIELDRLNVLYGGRLKKWSKNTESDIYKSQARAALATGALKATGTLLGGSSGSWPGFGSSGGDPMTGEMIAG